jgi:hypothetical protein
MNAGRIWYRARQFWQALGAGLLPSDRSQAQGILTPAQLALFESQLPSEQAHALRVLRALLEQGEDQPDLLIAALLHDVGKSRFSLTLWERVLIVLVGALCPGCLRRWGATGPETPHGWRRAFVIASQHPHWSAQLAAQAGCGPLAVELIRRHQQVLPEQSIGEAGICERLLRKLQGVDDRC